MSAFIRAPELLGSMDRRTPGTNTTFDIPLSHTYHMLALDIAVQGETVTPADWGDYIDQIELRVNGDAKIEISGANLYRLYSNKGFVLTDNFVPLFLSQPDKRTIFGEDVTGYGTQGLRNLQIDVRLSAGAHVIDRLDLYCKRGANAALGPHYRLSRYNENVTGAGRREFSGFTRDAATLYGVMMTTAAIDYARIKAGDATIHESTRAVRDGFLAPMGRQQMAGTTYLDCCPDDRWDEAFDVLGRDVRFTLEYTAAADTEVIVESVETL